MEQQLSTQIRQLIERAPSAWLKDVCIMLRNSPAADSPNVIKRRMPKTSNADLASGLYELIDVADGGVSWEALGYGLHCAFDVFLRERAGHQIEMLWSGPSPASHMPARRIDQALYDLIANARKEILLVTFAAARVDRLAAALTQAVERKVKVRLVLEFAESSEGQLTFDALKAFPSALVNATEVYFWPVEKRARNQAGRPGKLHAKLAVVDEVVLLSSANLTEDAFSRNLELGVMLMDSEVVRWARDHFGNLVKNSTLLRVHK